MIKFVLSSLLAVVFISCGPQPAPESQPAAASSARALKKIRYSSPQELERLRASGVEIIVQQADYVIVRTDSAAVSALAGVATEPIQEMELVQRLVHIKLNDSSDVQKIVDMGVDLWEIQADTAVARAYDLYLERLRAAGLAYRIVAQDASQPEGKE